MTAYGGDATSSCSVAVHAISRLVVGAFRATPRHAQRRQDEIPNAVIIQECIAYDLGFADHMNGFPPVTAIVAPDT